MSPLTNALLDWNTDLDDIMMGTVKKTPEVRRHSAPTSLPSRRKNLRVQFGQVQVRECERILGDNPACEVGPSLSLGWKYTTKKAVQVDAWEQQRQTRRNGAPRARRTSRDFYLTEDRRIELARQAGIAIKDITRNMELISYFHEERNETVMELHRERAARKEGLSTASRSSSLRQFSKLNTFLC